MTDSEYGLEIAKTIVAQMGTGIGIDRGIREIKVLPAFADGYRGGLVAKCGRRSLITIRLTAGDVYEITVIKNGAKTPIRKENIYCDELTAAVRETTVGV